MQLCHLAKNIKSDGQKRYCTKHIIYFQHQQLYVLRNEQIISLKKTGLTNHEKTEKPGLI